MTEISLYIFFIIRNNNKNNDIDNNNSEITTSHVINVKIFFPFFAHHRQNEN